MGINVGYVELQGDYIITNVNSDRHGERVIVDQEGTRLGLFLKYAPIMYLDKHSLFFEYNVNSTEGDGMEYYTRYIGVGFKYTF